MNSSPALVSVIIPTKNSAETLASCIQSVQRQTYSTIECIVVDNNSVDATVEIAKAEGAQVFEEGVERSSQRNSGASHANGEYILFVDSDMILDPSLISRCVSLLLKKPHLQGLTIPEVSVGITFWARCKQFERLCYEDISWMHAVRFFRMSAFRTMKGYDEQLIGGEDFDIHGRLRTQFGTLAIERATANIVHKEGNLSLLKLLSKKYYYGSTIRRYGRKPEHKRTISLQANPFIRIGLFFRNPTYFLIHPLLFLGTCIMKLLEFCALGLGYIKSYTLY